MLLAVAAAGPTKAAPATSGAMAALDEQSLGSAVMPAQYYGYRRRYYRRSYNYAPRYYAPSYGYGYPAYNYNYAPSYGYGYRYGY
jgi:hypothetical protein